MESHTQSNLLIPVGMVLAVTLILFLPSLLLLALLLRRRPRHPLPPGPRPWPLVGNLVHLFLLHRRYRQPPHALLAALAHTYGPLLHLRLGARHFVVASSPSAAAHVLKTRDRELSGRQVPATFRIPFYANRSLAWAPRCDSQWKSLRALCRGVIFSPRSVEALAAVRERKAREMVVFLLAREGEEVNVGELAFRTVFNMLGNMLFSRDVVGEEEPVEKGGGSWDLRRAMSRSLELGMMPNVEDFYPAVFGGLDLQGLRREVRKNVDRIYGVWDEVFGERRREIEGGSGGGPPREAREDFLELLLGSDYDDLQVKALFLDIFTAGTDTSAALIEWTMAELIQNPGAMNRVRYELERVIGSPDESGRGGTATTVRESDLAHVPYLQACIKETLRLHPPVPLLLPHRAVDTCEAMGYTIPADSAVLVNVWAIGRDPKVWEEPLRFRPERFLGCSVDDRDTDFEFVPFGAGRRACPGLPLAARMVPLVVASMVHSFEWALPGGMGPEQLGMGERLGLVLEREQPLVIVPRPSAGLAG